MSAASTRRHLLGDAIAGIAGAVILPGAEVTMATTEALGGSPGQADNPLADAELTALCDQFCRLERALALDLEA